MLAAECHAKSVQTHILLSASMFPRHPYPSHPSFLHCHATFPCPSRNFPLLLRHSWKIWASRSSSSRTCSPARAQQCGSPTSAAPLSSPDFVFPDSVPSSSSWLGIGHWRLYSEVFSVRLRSRSSCHWLRQLCADILVRSSIRILLVAHSLERMPRSLPRGIWVGRRLENRSRYCSTRRRRSMVVAVPVGLAGSIQPGRRRMGILAHIQTSDCNPAPP